MTDEELAHIIRTLQAEQLRRWHQKANKERENEEE